MPPSAVPRIVAAVGGGFLLEERTPDEVFTPEDLNEEQRQVAATTAQFAGEEILPAVAAIEAKQPDVMAGLLRKAAELGFTSVDIPEKYGGMGMDKVTSTLVTDHISVLASFSTAFGAHIGIASLPLLWYGTEEQKQRYLPKLVRCEWIGAYGLSEASSGSDAMNIRTRATLTADGSHYILDGEKQWITNCGIAGLYTIFAKIDGGEILGFPGGAGDAGSNGGRRRAQAWDLRLIDLPAKAEWLQGSGGESAGRGRQGPPHCFQCAECRPVQAGRGLHRRRATGAERDGALRPRAAGVWQADRRVRNDPAQALAKRHAPLRRPRAWPIARLG